MDSDISGINDIAQIRQNIFWRITYERGLRFIRRKETQ